jgi:hypothetical protein
MNHKEMPALNLKIMKILRKYKWPLVSIMRAVGNKFVLSPKQNGRQKAEPVVISQPAAVGISVTLFVLWAVVTYLFEGHILTLQRSEAISDSA